MNEFPPLRAHYPQCSRPGMLWHEQIGQLPVMGHCPDCGAVAKRGGSTGGGRRRRPARRNPQAEAHSQARRARSTRKAAAA